MINVQSGVAGTNDDPYTSSNPAGGRAYNVNIVSGGTSDGTLQIAGGVSLDSTLRTVTDSTGTPVSSPLQLSTTQVAIIGNGAASKPAFSGVGTWYTGGSATTTKPYWLIEPAGTTSTNWSTSGTGLGINAPSGFAGNLLDIQLNGSKFFDVQSNGNSRCYATLISYDILMNNNTYWTSSAGTARLSLPPGAAAAGRAPLKFSPGTNLTTPEDGAFEYDGTTLYFTVGAVRKTVTLV